MILFEKQIQYEIFICGEGGTSCENSKEEERNRESKNTKKEERNQKSEEKNVGKGSTKEEEGKLRRRRG